jgi:hypothetical protein
MCRLRCASDPQLPSCPWYSESLVPMPVLLSPPTPYPDRINKKARDGNILAVQWYGWCTSGGCAGRIISAWQTSPRCSHDHGRTCYPSCTRSEATELSFSVSRCTTTHIFPIRISVSTNDTAGLHYFWCCSSDSLHIALFTCKFLLLLCIIEQIVMLLFKICHILFIFLRNKSITLRILLPRKLECMWSQAEISRSTC